MKTLIFLTLIVIVCACEEDDIHGTPDLYSGRYSYESADISFAFDLVREYGIYKGQDARVTHPSISATEGRDAEVFTYNRTTSGYQQITIRSYGEIQWEVNMIGVVFTKEGMSVSEIRAEFPNTTELVLTDVTLEK